MATEDGRKVIGGPAAPVYVENTVLPVKTGPDAFQVSILGNMVVIPTTRYIRKYKQTLIASSQTDSTVITAVAGKRIRVLGMFVNCGATATQITFNSGSAGNQVTPTISNGANGGFVLPISPTDDAGWFQTEIGAALVATTGAGDNTAILTVYCEV